MLTKGGRKTYQMVMLLLFFSFSSDFFFVLFCFSEKISPLPTVVLQFSWNFVVHGYGWLELPISPSWQGDASTWSSTWCDYLQFLHMIPAFSQEWSEASEAYVNRKKLALFMCLIVVDHFELYINIVYYMYLCMDVTITCCCLCFPFHTTLLFEQNSVLRCTKKTLEIKEVREKKIYHKSPRLYSQSCFLQSSQNDRNPAQGLFQRFWCFHFFIHFGDYSSTLDTCCHQKKPTRCRHQCLWKRSSLDRRCWGLWDNVEGITSAPCGQLQCGTSDRTGKKCVVAETNTAGGWCETPGLSLLIFVMVTQMLHGTGIFTIIYLHLYTIHAASGLRFGNTHTHQNRLRKTWKTGLRTPR